MTKNPWFVGVALMVLTLVIEHHISTKKPAAKKAAAPYVPLPTHL